MIKSTQKKFVIITAIIMLAVFAMIFAFTCIILRNATTYSIMDNLKNMKVRYSSDSEAPLPPDSLFAQFIIPDRNKPNEIDIKGPAEYDARAFKDVDIEKLIEEAVAKREKAKTGKIGLIFYEIDDESQPMKIYAVDGTTYFEKYDSYILKVFIGLSILFIILVFLTWFLSYLVFKPIRENFERQKKFISDASHELKTPLSIINASADVIKAEDNENRWVENIKQQTERMNVLVTDMLALAKLEEAPIVVRKETFDLSEEIINCVLPFEAMVFENNKRIIYEVQEGIKATTDRNAVKMVTNILLDNAVKYASDSGKIVIKLFKKKKKTVFSVYNTGSNVPDKDSARIFERFYRADNSRSRACGGSGLGLAIAKNLANKNKWKIYAKSVFGVSMQITIVI